MEFFNAVARGVSMLRKPSDMTMNFPYFLDNVQKVQTQHGERVSNVTQSGDTA